MCFHKRIFQKQSKIINVPCVLGNVKLIVTLESYLLCELRAKTHQENPVVFFEISWALVSLATSSFATLFGLMFCLFVFWFVWGCCYKSCLTWLLQQILYLDWWERLKSRIWEYLWTCLQCCWNSVWILSSATLNMVEGISNNDSKCSLGQRQILEDV